MDPVREQPFPWSYENSISDTLTLSPTPDTAIVWRDSSVYLLDQHNLPAQAGYLQLSNATATADVIGDIVVRGAPAIGITATYGVVLEARETYTENPEPALLAEACRIHALDIADNRSMGDPGAALLEGPTSVITHCNAGALATGGYGTAPGVIRNAHIEGKINQVYADETRP